MTRLRSLTIHRFRHVVPGCSIQFGDKTVALLGKNGTGKTTLLELLAAIWSWDFSAFANEELHIEYAFEFRHEQEPPGWVRVTVQNVVEPLEQLDEGASAGDYRTPSGQPASVGRERCVVRLAQLVPKQRHDYVISVENGLAELTPADLEIYPLGPVGCSMFGWSKPFGTIKALVRSPLVMVNDVLSALITGQSVPWDAVLMPIPSMGPSEMRFTEDVSWLASPLRKLMIEGLEGERFRNLALGGFPFATSDMAKAAASAIPEHPRPLPTSLTLSSVEVPTLAAIAELMDLDMIEVRLDLEHGDADRKGVRSFSYRAPAIFVTKKDGTRLPLARLSYGQKRLFGMMWYLSLLPHVALIDELANGLHYDLVEQVLHSLGERQSFLAMQDPLVLDHLVFADADDVRHCFVLCESELDSSGRESWRWSNFSEDAAQDVFESWAVGIQHVNQILRTRGLW